MSPDTPTDYLARRRHLMRLYVSKAFLLLFLPILIINSISSFAGEDSEFSGGVSMVSEDAQDDGGIFTFFAIPILYPYFDWQRTRQIIRLRKPAPAMSIPDPIVAQFQDQDPFMHAEPFLMSPLIPDKVDALGRKVIVLGHGDESFPHHVQDISMVNFGLVGGLSFQDGETFILQYNAVAKLKYVRSFSTSRSAEDYPTALKMKRLDWPKKAEDFNSWDNGDSIDRRAIMGVGLYAGVSAILPDIRAGGVLVGDWHVVFTKVDEFLIRGSFTREGGIGFTARLQPVPLTKVEGTKLKNFEGTLVYTFDISTEVGRVRLERALNNHIFIRPTSDDDSTSLLTKRTIKRTRNTRNLQAGIPVLARIRRSWHNEWFSSKLKNKNDNVKKSEARIRFSQSAKRHINLPKRNNKGKKLKYFLHHNTHKNKENRGLAEWNQHKADGKEFTKLSLIVDITYRNDKVLVKEINDYNKSLSKRVGLNDFFLDLNFTKQKKLKKSELKAMADDSDSNSTTSTIDSDSSTSERDPRNYREVEDKNKLIGYVELSYHLAVGTTPLLEIIEKAHNDKHLFDETNNEIIFDYFYTKKDPHKICRGRHLPYNWCVNFVKFKTKRATDKIAHHLRKIKKPSKISRKSISSRLFNISKLASESQFTLGSFVSVLPENPKGYGIYKIRGEKFLSERFIVDPKNQRQTTNEAAHDAFDPYNNLDDEDYDMF